MITPTPRTDKAEVQITTVAGKKLIVSSDFARELESELCEATAKIAHLEAMLSGTGQSEAAF